MDGYSRRSMIFLGVLGKGFVKFFEVKRGFVGG